MQNSTKPQEKISTTFKRLSIQIDLGGLSFCIFSPALGCIESVWSLPLNTQASTELVKAELRQYLSEQSELRQDFDTIGVLHNNPFFALVPKPYFTTEQIGQYLRYNSYGQTTELMAYEEIPQMEVVNTYLPFSDMNAVIRETYGKFHYEHLSTQWLKMSFAHHHGKGKGVYAFFQEGGFYLAMYESGALLFLNYFAYNDHTDMLYYLLFAMQEVGLSPNEVPLYLAGSIIRRSDAFALLYKYVRHIYFLPHQGKPFCLGVEGALARRVFVLTHAFV